MTPQTLVVTVVVVGGVGSKGGGGLETGEGESGIVITSWLLVPLLEVTTLGLSGGAVLPTSRRRFSVGRLSDGFCVVLAVRLVTVVKLGMGGFCVFACWPACIAGRRGLVLEPSSAPDPLQCCPPAAATGWRFPP